MAKIDREVIYDQMVLFEIDGFYAGLPKSIRYERKKGTATWSKLSLVCGATNMKPNELLDWMIDGAFKYVFQVSQDET